jgi:NAD(P)-dependent dehydrogenase (short-subunit alcohol dehydrogenase family)
MKLAGKTVIVTGGARGIGKAYALALAQEGAHVAVADVLDGTAVVEEIVRNGSEAVALRTDVSDEKSVNSMTRAVEERFGRIDVLVNNAGIFVGLSRKPFYELTVEEWDRVMNVNLKGIFLCSKAVYPQMKKQGKGKIINVSSATFFMGVPFLSHYVASKGGVIALTRTMARELGDDNICVNAIAPGFTVSEALQGSPAYPEERLQMLASGRCFKRNEMSEDLTGTVVFLASSDSDFITGQTIIVDGGGAFV